MRQAGKMHSSRASRIRRSLPFLLPLLILPSFNAFGDGGRRFAVLVARAEVRPSATFRFEQKTVELNVTAADVANGYVEIQAASLLQMNLGNVKAEIYAEFMPENDAIASIEIRTEEGWQMAADVIPPYLAQSQVRDVNALPSAAAGRPSSLDLSGQPASAGTTIAALPATDEATPDPALVSGPGLSPDTGARKVGLTNALSYRFKLGPTAVPGRYQVPVVLNILL